MDDVWVILTWFGDIVNTKSRQCLRNRAHGLVLGCPRPSVAAQGHPAWGPKAQGLGFPGCNRGSGTTQTHPDDLGEPRPSPWASFGSHFNQMHYPTTWNQFLCYNDWLYKVLFFRPPSSMAFREATLWLAQYECHPRQGFTTPGMVYT